MSFDEQLEQIINQTIEGAAATIPMHLQEIEGNKDALKVKDTKEFVYGLIMGISLGMGSAFMSTITKRAPTPEDSAKVSDMILKRMPKVREQIFK